MHLQRTLAFVIGCAMLASCEGDDSTPPPTMGGGGTPSPSPTPTPTPTPTPISYTRFADLTGDRNFQTACAGVQQGNLQGITASDFGEGISQGRGLEVAFGATNGTWTITGPGFVTAFAPADADPMVTAPSIGFVRTSANGFRDRFTIGARPFGTQAVEYVRGSRLFYQVEASRVVDFFCVLGVPTLINDTRPASTVTYTAFNLGGTMITNGPTGGGQFDLGDSTVTLSANPTNGQVIARLTLIGRQFTPAGLSTTQTPLGTYEGTAVTDGTRTNFSSPLGSSDRTSLNSGFAGWFFGPQGLEAGFAFNIIADAPDGTRLTGAGVVTARR